MGEWTKFGVTFISSSNFGTGTKMRVKFTSCCSASRKTNFHLLTSCKIILLVSFTFCCSESQLSIVGSLIKRLVYSGLLDVK